jgi:uncharacterized membrane protein YfhO
VVQSEFNKGKIKPDHQKLLFFSIPFDKGWVAKVDNKKVKPLLVNIGFTGILVDPGEHEIELSFVSRFFNLGAVISCLSIIVFLVILVIKYLLDKKASWLSKEKMETVA